MKLGKWMFWRPNERRVLLMGLDYSGKTTLLYRWVLDEPFEPIPTIGFNLETIKYPTGLTFQVWDVGGCDKLRPLHRHYFSDTDAVIYMHNCADMERLDEQVQVLTDYMSDEALHRVPVLVVLSVQDLMAPDTRNQDMEKILTAYDELIACFKRPALLKVFHSPGFSAKTTENTHIVLDEVAKMLADKNGAASASKAAAGADPLQPSTDELDAERARTLVDADAMTTDDFWHAFGDGSLAPWDHYNHLKSGFFVLIEAFEQGRGVLDAAETFIGHLERLRKGNPERFRNTTHRTMTIFWLAQLHVAALNYINTTDTKRVLAMEDFKAVLLHTPQLTDSRLWGQFYSKSVLFSQEAKERWSLPNIKPLPSVVAAEKHQRAGQAPPPTAVDADRLIGFGLTVVQQTLASQGRRGPIVKAALAALESSTMRERAVTTAIAPYSATQAYFWVQTVHAAIATAASATDAEKTPGSSLTWAGSVESLTLPAFKALFGIAGDEWRAHYSPALWESLGARMQFLPPDKKPLPNLIAVHDGGSVRAARGAMVQSYAAEKEPRAELPPPQALAVMAAVLVQELAEDGSGGSEHGVMIQALFKTLRSSQDKDRRVRSRAIADALALPCAGVDGLTQRLFWVQQVLAAVGRFEGTDFGAFVRTHAWLAYKDLPLVYYSPMLWASEEAKAVR
ncbi:ARF-like GTPase ARLP2 [Cordyceps militaris]|uniref:ARF-like GTPase ARLP2 n=1 Tax=Cordyceps militaris TaxID=73501 RepID=A0A2H4SW90_CORMI|nr:ARF-like GTPase ARLP2 [Cordyceps militaris]